MSDKPIYRVWQTMRDRCYREGNKDYKHYGGRGIYVCDRWQKFENFFEDMGDRPEGTELDRIDNNGPYCKENCRWITHQKNCNNRRGHSFPPIFFPIKLRFT